MNVQQTVQVKEILNSLKEHNIEDIMDVVFGDSSDYSVVIVHNFYTVNEFINYHNRFIKQLEEELNRGLKQMLPYQYNFQNDFGGGNLYSDLVNYNSFLINPKIRQAEPWLARLVYYQIANGFWNKSKYKVHNANDIKLKEKESKLKQVIIELENKSKDYDNLKLGVDGLNDKLIDSLNRDVKLINSLIENDKKARDFVADIVKNNNESENLKIQINSVLEQQQKYLLDIKTTLKEEKKQFESYKKENISQQEINKNLIKGFKEKNSEIKEILSFTDDRRIFLEEKEAEIIKLTGMAADSAMGSKYYDREKSLEKGLKFWKYAVPVITIFAISWVIAVFTCFQTETSNVYFDIIINLLKTSPAFVLMGFVFNQYKKERNLQEEYAFKSAVAMTINAYSDLLKNEDTEDNLSRQESLLSAIKQIQTPPYIYQEKKGKMFSVNSKDLNESIKNLTDLIKKNN